MKPRRLFKGFAERLKAGVSERFMERFMEGPIGRLWLRFFNPEPYPSPSSRRVKTPTVIQMEAIECGAASLGIVLGYYRRFEPLETLREICGVSRDGTKAGNILKAGRHFGMEASGAQIDAETVLDGMFPAIVFWKFSHFLVVEGRRGDTVYLNDPAFGPRKVTIEEFSRNFSGVALYLSPGESFCPHGRKSSIFRELRKRMAGYGGPLWTVFAISVLLALPTVAIPGFVKIFVDDVLIAQKWGWVSPILLGLGTALTLSLVLKWIQQMVLLRMEFRFALAQSAHFVWCVLRLPIEFFDRRHAGDISTRIDSNDNVASLIAGEFGGSLLGTVMAIFFVVVMLLYDVTLTVIVVTTTLGNIWILRWVQRVRSDGVLRLKTEQARLFSNSAVSLQTIETIKAAGSEDDCFSKWSGLHTGVLNTEQKLALYEQATAVAPSLFSTLATALLIGVGGRRVMDGSLTLGELLAFQTLYLGVTGPTETLMRTAGQVQSTWGDLVRIEDVYHQPLDPRHRRDDRDGDRGEKGERDSVATKEAAVGLATLRPVAPRASDRREESSGELALKDLSFGYARLEPPLLNGLSLHLKPGGWAALVGRSGSGKSTVTKLLSGLYQPWGGEILIDGRPLGSYDRERLGEIVSVVDQEAFAFEGTIHDNVTLWDRSRPREAAAQAIRDADLEEFVEHFPGNYDGMLREGGENMSGGQRQRLAIARALASEPTVLILDEATSALDTLTEKRVADAIRRRGCSCVIVAHRLSAIRDCDEIIVLDQGQVIERGTHDELMRMSGFYATLVTHE